MTLGFSWNLYCIYNIFVHSKNKSNKRNVTNKRDKRYVKNKISLSEVLDILDISSDVQYSTYRR